MGATGKSGGKTSGFPPSTLGPTLEVTIQQAPQSTYLGSPSPSKSNPTLFGPSSRRPKRAHAVAHFRFLASASPLPAPECPPLAEPLARCLQPVHSSWRERIKQIEGKRPCGTVSVTGTVLILLSRFLQFVLLLQMDQKRHPTSTNCHLRRRSNG